MMRLAAPGTKEDSLFVGALDFDTVRFDVRIFLERIVDDAAVERGHWFEFNDIAPAADFFGGVFRFANKSVAGLGAVTADVHGHLRQGRILLIEEAVEQILQFGQCLALPSNEAAGIFCLHVEQQTVVEVVFVDTTIEAKALEELLENFFWIGSHKVRVQQSAFLFRRRHGRGSRGCGPAGLIFVFRSR